MVFVVVVAVSVVVLVVGMHELHITGQYSSTFKLADEIVPQPPDSSVWQKSGSGMPLHTPVVVVVVLVVHVPHNARQFEDTSNTPAAPPPRPQSLSDSAAHSSGSNSPLQRRPVVTVVVAVVVAVAVAVDVSVDFLVLVTVEVAVDVSVLCMQPSNWPFISSFLALSSKPTSALHEAVSCV